MRRDTKGNKGPDASGSGRTADNTGQFHGSGGGTGRSTGFLPGTGRGNGGGKRPGFVLCALIGIVTGLANGLFGSGGGTIAVPAMVHICSGWKSTGPMPLP